MSAAGNTNYTAGSFVGHIYYPLYELIAVSNLGSSAYETGTVNPQYTFNITKAANNATFTLNVNGINVSNTIQNVNAGTNLYSPEYQIPLQEVNGTVYTFNAILTGKGSFGSITEQADSSTQKELWNYYPVISVSPNPNIVGDNVSLNTAITQKVNLDLANVSGDVLLGDKTISERVNSLYNYTALLLSFIPSKYNLTMPSGTLPATYNWKSVIKLSFGSQNLYRNATGSATPHGNTAINTYYPALTACPTGTPSINWDFWSVSAVPLL